MYLFVRNCSVTVYVCMYWYAVCLSTHNVSAYYLLFLSTKNHKIPTHIVILNYILSLFTYNQKDTFNEA